jgi:hypothetical protein
VPVDTAAAAPPPVGSYHIVIDNGVLPGSTLNKYTKTHPAHPISRTIAPIAKPETCSLVLSFDDKYALAELAFLSATWLDSLRRNRVEMEDGTEVATTANAQGVKDKIAILVPLLVTVVAACADILLTE